MTGTVSTAVKTHQEFIQELARQLEVTTMFLQLDARKLREQGRGDAAEPTEKQIAANLAMIQKARAMFYAEAVAVDEA